MEGGSTDVAKLPVATAFSEKDMIIFDLQKHLDSEQAKNKYLEDQIRIRVTAFINREESAKKIVDALEERLSKSLSDDGNFETKMQMLRELHGSVVHSIEQLQASTNTILQHQEQELMRGFRQRFEEVSQEVDSLRNKRGDFNAELQTRLKKLTTELLSTQELVQILEAKNTQLFSENKKLTETLKSQQDDRQALLMELVVLKKQKIKTTPTSARPQTATVAVDRPETPSKPKVVSHTVPNSREAKLREEILCLTKQLKFEKLRVAELRAENLSLFGEDDDLKKFLVSCISDVKTAVAKRGQAPFASVADFSAKNRRQVLKAIFASDLIT